MTYIFYITAEWDRFNYRDFIIELANINSQDNFIVINRPVDLLSKIMGRKENKIRENEIINNGLTKNITENLVIIRPKILCHDNIFGKFFYSYLNKLNVYLIEKQIKNNNLLIQDKITIWMYQQIHWPIVDIFKSIKNRKVIWEIYDDYRLKANGSIRKEFINSEKILINKIDLIFTLTEGLKNKYINNHNNIKIIGNGYNSKFFNNKLKTYKSIEKELMNIPHPRIGYIGYVRDWIDFELLESSIIQNNNYSFVIIGPIQNDIKTKIDKLKKHSNVYFLGKKDKDQVGIYMKEMDVGIIPYIKNEFTKNVKPLKLYEFLACETPVVTSTSADIKEEEGALYIYNNNEDFNKKLNLALENKNKNLCENLSKPWSWNQIIKDRVLPNVKK